MSPYIYRGTQNDIVLFLIVFATCSQLYNESKSLHATHDASLLKSAEDQDRSRTKLSKAILTRLQAGAFESLCQHLKDRSELVQNMELMTISGFCRNCLAKVSSNTTSGNTYTRKSPKFANYALSAVACG